MIRAGRQRWSTCKSGGKGDVKMEQLWGGSRGGEQMKDEDKSVTRGDKIIRVLRV
jgi:hypothetical protein